MEQGYACETSETYASIPYAIGQRHSILMQTNAGYAYCRSKAQYLRTSEAAHDFKRNPRLPAQLSR